MFSHVFLIIAKAGGLVKQCRPPQAFNYFIYGVLSRFSAGFSLFLRVFVFFACTGKKNGRFLPALFRMIALFFLRNFRRLLFRALYECAEQRVGRFGRGRKFGVELHAHKEGMIFHFHRFYNAVIGRSAAHHKPRVFKRFAVVVVKFVSVEIGRASCRERV